MTTTAQMMADAIDINTRCCGRDCTDCPRKVSAELRRLDAVEAENKRLQQAHDIACEIGAQYADERDQLRAQVERLQGGDPVARSDGDSNIESQFNACMHKEYCLSLKAGQIRPLDENALAHTINMMPWRTDELGPQLREFAAQLWLQFCSVPAAPPAPAVPQGEPVAWLDLSKMSASAMVYATGWKSNDKQSPLYTAAPSQPVTLTDDVAENALRYVWLRDVHIGNNPEYINLNPVKNGGLDAAIDALREKEALR